MVAIGLGFATGLGRGCDALALAAARGGGAGTDSTGGGGAIDAGTAVVRSCGAVWGDLVARMTRLVAIVSTPSNAITTGARLRGGLLRLRTSTV